MENNMEMINEVVNNEEVTDIIESIPEVLADNSGNAVGKMVFVIGTIVVTVVGLTVSIKRRKAKGATRTKQNFLVKWIIRLFEKKGYTVVKLDEVGDLDEEVVTVQDIN